MSPSWLRPLQLVEVEMLDELVRICDKYHLTYYLVGGTLLGAIRHKGFIPWDDDIDVSMPRDDYNKLLEIAQREIQPPYFFEAWQLDPNSPYFHMRIRKLNTAYENWRNQRFGLKCTGIWIDIFPLDAQRSTRDPILCLDSILLKLISKTLYGYNDSDPKSPIGKVKSWIMHRKSFDWYRQQRDKIIRRHEGQDTPYIKEPTITKGLFSFCRTMYKKEWFEPSATAEFEGKQYRIPGNADAMLRNFYGDYMKLPPESQRKQQHAPRRVSFNTNGPDEPLKQ